MTETENQKSPIHKRTIFTVGEELLGEKKLTIVAVLSYSFFLFFFVQKVVDFIIFVVALLLGIFLFFADRRYFSSYYHEKPDENFYVTQSALFIFSLIPLALYVFTSAGSFWALGIMSGIFIFIITEMYRLIRKPLIFSENFLQGMKVEISEKKARLVFYSFFTFFVLIHFFVIL